MISSSRAVILISFVVLAAAYDNNPPIPGDYPGFEMGSNLANIKIEIGYDLMCSDSAKYDPFFQDFLNMPFTSTKNTLVSEAIRYNYVLMPLPYHHETWVAHKLVAQFVDACYSDANSCQYHDYIHYCF